MRRGFASGLLYNVYFHMLGNARQNCERRLSAVLSIFTYDLFYSRTLACLRF